MTLNLKLSRCALAAMRRFAVLAGCLVLFASMSVADAQETGKALKIHVNNGEPQFFNALV